MYYFEITITKRVIHYLFLIFFMTSDYYEPFTENFEENNFETSDIELYRNKQNFRTAFSIQLFGKKGKYFFFGTPIFIDFCFK